MFVFYWGFFIGLLFVVVLSVGCGFKEEENLLGDWKFFFGDEFFVVSNLLESDFLSLEVIGWDDVGDLGDVGDFVDSGDLSIRFGGVSLFFMIDGLGGDDNLILLIGDLNFLGEIVENGGGLFDEFNDNVSSVF